MMMNGSGLGKSSIVIGQGPSQGSNSNSNVTFSGIPRISPSPSPQNKNTTIYGKTMSKNVTSSSNTNANTSAHVKSDNSLLRSANTNTSTQSNYNYFGKTVSSVNMSQSQEDFNYNNRGEQMQGKNTSQYGSGVGPSNKSSQKVPSQFIKKSSGGQSSSFAAQNGLKGQSGLISAVRDKWNNISGSMDDLDDAGGGGGGGGGNGGQSRRPKFSVGGPMRQTNALSKKGILKSSKGNSKRKMNVSFHKEVMEVISYGEDPATKAKALHPTSRSPNRAYDDDSGSSSEEETPIDPLDSVSIAELLDKSSTTHDEKAFHKLTQKNTNFNSIKTNLLGKTNIEIGPIVGCTGGKSMENSSKPLVSIGTFESRKEPLKINRKIDQDSDERDCDRPRISTNTNSTNSTNSPTKSDKQVTTTPPMKSTLPKVPINNVNILPQPQKTITNTIVVKNDNPSPVEKPMPKVTKIDQINNLRHEEKPKPIVTTSSPTKPAIVNKKPEPVVNVTLSSAKDAQQIKPKSILKNSQQSPKVTNPTSTTSSSTALSNLIILTEGNNITSKRTSFLKDLISSDNVNVPESGTSGTRSNSQGVTIVNTTGSGLSMSMDQSQPSLDEKDSLEVPPPPPTSKIPSDDDDDEKEDPLPRSKVTNVNLGEKIVRPVLVTSIISPGSMSKVSFPLNSNSNSGTQKSLDSATDSSEFDDSLEDSGLDIGGKVQRTEMEIASEESDEKSGSSSDSGNENDYIERVKGQSRGLFISVEEEFDPQGSKVTLKKPEPAKLSPDSVLFSSASEMSASGSTESISELSEEKLKLKRPAPPIPQIETQEIYANQGPTFDLDLAEEEGVYDDVANYKNYNNIQELEAEEESIYDDCTVKNPEEKVTGVTGSYNFAEKGPSGGEDEDDPVLLTTRSDGIEFIGIRKIDSETFLRERSPSPKRSGTLGSIGKRERSSSTSPKARRKVNQFFSTIGKKAGAAFSNSHLSNYTRNKSPVTMTSKSPQDDSHLTLTQKEYRRSLSTDEVSMTRTQEIYATLTPTSLKFKGLAPVLHKLSKMDLNMNNNEKNNPPGVKGEDDDSPDTKMFKKHNKISSSIKKFLRFGNQKEDAQSKYDFFPPTNTNSNPAPTNQMTISSPLHPSLTSEESGSSFSSEDKPKTIVVVRKPSVMSKPPPPPPRVHSLDLLHKVGASGQNGTIGVGHGLKPARPPPPVRHNKVAPSFTSVFNNNLEGPLTPSGMGVDFAPVDILTPPSKPKRKNSVNHSNGVARDLETSYNHITNLNLETLRLIANQPLTKIRAKSSNFGSGGEEKLSWSQFDMQTGLRPEPMIHGVGFAFYPAQFQGGKVILLIQESTSAPGFSAPFQFSCVHTETTFVDVIPPEFVTWEPSDYVKTDSGIKGIISVLPSLNIWRVEEFVKCAEVPQKEKYLALLQAMDYWGSEELSDLLVLKQAPSGPLSQGHQLDLPSSLIYVHPIPLLTTFTRGQRSSSKSTLCDFEMRMKQLLLTTPAHDLDFPDEEGLSILNENDRQMLLQKMSGSSQEIQAQFKLFFQLKLFAPSTAAGVVSQELARIRKYRSEQSIQQWLDKERALCMKDAVERSIARNTNNSKSSENESISPFKKSYLEFLMQTAKNGGNSAKAILDMFVDLFE